MYCSLYNWHLKNTICTHDCTHDDIHVLYMYTRRHIMTLINRKIVDTLGGKYHMSQ